MHERTRQRWFDLRQKLELPGDLETTLQALINCYSGDQRAYHVFGHIEHCLDEFEPARYLAKDETAVEEAIWHHDIVYDTHGSRNEERSAELFRSAHGRFLPAQFVEKVEEMILATKHSSIPADSDTRLLLDVDLSILGQSPVVFDEYEKQIRAEYSWVSDKRFAAGRSDILKTFLERPAIYLTDFFRNKYESQAEANLKRSLEQLSKSL